MGVPKVSKKPKAEVNKETGVRSGTKKAMTFNLTYRGMPIEEIIQTVLKAFPDAQEKSIKIWSKKALKQKREKTT